MEGGGEAGDEGGRERGQWRALVGACWCYILDVSMTVFRLFRYNSNASSKDNATAAVKL